MFCPNCGTAVEEAEACPVCREPHTAPSEPTSGWQLLAVVTLVVFALGVAFVLGIRVLGSDLGEFARSITGP
jgi:hypothetical protein